MSSSIPMNGPIGPSASPKPPVGKLAKVDAYAAMQIENLYLKVQNLAVRQCLETVLEQPDIRIVLATPIREDGQTRRLLVEAVQPVAEQLQMDAYDCTAQVDAVDFEIEQFQPVLQALDRQVAAIPRELAATVQFSFQSPQ